MVQACQFVKWSGFGMVVWKPDKNVCFMVLHVLYLNHVRRPFELETSFNQCCSPKEKTDGQWELVTVFFSKTGETGDMYYVSIYN